MTAFEEFLRGNPVAVLSLVLGLGYLIGKTKIHGFEAGSVSGVLFVGLLFGHFGFGSAFLIVPARAIRCESRSALYEKVLLQPASWCGPGDGVYVVPVAVGMVLLEHQTRSPP